MLVTRAWPPPPAGYPLSQYLYMLRSECDARYIDPEFLEPLLGCFVFGGLLGTSSTTSEAFAFKHGLHNPDRRSLRALPGAILVNPLN